MSCIRTFRVRLIVLVRIGPDIVSAASLSLASATDRAVGPDWLVSPPAAVSVRLPAR
ncbi:hypothetical protein ACRAWG_30360 [Methylobacterium sp. P31]